MNGTTDYKMGKVEQQINDVNVALRDWKNTDHKQHSEIIEQLQELRKESKVLWGDVRVLKAQALWISAGISTGIAVIGLALKILL